MRVQVILSDQEGERLKAFAEEQDRTLSNMARRLIVDGMKPKVDVCVNIIGNPELDKVRNITI